MSFRDTQFILVEEDTKEPLRECLMTERGHLGRTNDLPKANLIDFSHESFSPQPGMNPQR